MSKNGRQSGLVFMQSISPYFMVVRGYVARSNSCNSEYIKCNRVLFGVRYRHCHSPVYLYAHPSILPLPGHFSISQRASRLPRPPTSNLYFTSKPSPRKHSLCSSINRLQSASSSPLAKMQASRACLVSGQQQQIFLPDLMPTFCDDLQSFSLLAAGAGADAEFPMMQ